MELKQHKPIFADRVKITSEWSAGANVTKTFAKYGWVPPSIAAARQAEQGRAIAAEPAKESTAV